MTEPWGNLRIDVVDDEIIVTLPFTDYTVTYYKPPNSPQLLAKNFPSKDNSSRPNYSGRVPSSGLASRQ